MSQDFNQMFRPTTWEQLVGQTDIKQIITTAIESGNFPRFSIFCGPSGIGKSCMAEVTAHTLVCESTDSHKPCGKCQACSSKNSRQVIKYNMAKMMGKKDIVSVLDEIFKFEGLFGKTVYILEEVQVLKQTEEQAPFLEELTKVPDDVYIMMCTTHVHKLLPALRNRATIFQLSVPTANECIELIQTVTETLGIRPMTQGAMASLAALSEYVPRNILKHMQLLSSTGEITQDNINKFFHTVSQYDYISCLNILVDPEFNMVEFVKAMQRFKARTSMVQLLTGLKGFVLTALIEASTQVADPSISRSDRNHIAEVMSKVSFDDFLRLIENIGRLQPSAFTDDKEAEFQLITLKMKMMNLSAKKVVTENRMQVAAARSQSIHQTQHFSQPGKNLTEITTNPSDDELEAILGIQGGPV